MKKVALLFALGMMLSGCFMAPIAMLGPAISIGTTGSYTQAALQAGLNYAVKKTTGQSLTQHALNAVMNDKNIKQAYLPSETDEKTILPESK